MSSQVTTKEIAAVDAAYEIDIKSGANTTVAFNDGVGGDATAGTITIKASAPGSKVFNDVAGITPIDIAAQEPQTILNTPAARLELTLAGFTGDAKTLKLVITTWT